MTKDEATARSAMKLALEALENWLEFDPENFGEADKKAITALREALAQERSSDEQSAQRKPLTDEEWQSIADTLGCFITRGQKDAIEAALGIKENT